MKNLYLILVIVLFQPVIQAQDSITVNSLPKFELLPNGVQPIVITIDSSNAKELYKKTLNWVQETYKNPEKVLKTNIENEKIRVDGFKDNVWNFQNKLMGVNVWYDVEYSFNIDFKDNKMRMSFTFGDTYSDGVKSTIDYNHIYKENGELYKTCKNTPEGMNQMMNELSLSLYNYLTIKKKSDW